MKKSLILFFVLLIAALSVLSVSAAYYDQNGNAYWCNTDSYGCWITAEDGAHEYIMFWSEAARDYIMGSGSDAPVILRYNRSKLPLKDPVYASIVKSVTGRSGGNTDTTTGGNTGGTDTTTGGDTTGGDTSGGDSSGSGEGSGTGTGGDSSSGGDSGEGTGSDSGEGTGTDGGTGSDSGDSSGEKDATIPAKQEGTTSLKK